MFLPLEVFHQEKPPVEVAESSWLPVYLALCTPGAPPSASTSRPESSLTAGRPGGLHRRLRLQEGVLLERLPRLVHLEVAARLALRNHLDARSRRGSHVNSSSLFLLFDASISFMTAAPPQRTPAQRPSGRPRPRPRQRISPAGPSHRRWRTRCRPWPCRPAW